MLNPQPKRVVTVGVFGPEYPWTVLPGLASTLGVVIVGGLWAYVNHHKERKELLRRAVEAQRQH
jgi:hypothetical protein